MRLLGHLPLSKSPHYLRCRASAHRCDIPSATLVPTMSPYPCSSPPPIGCALARVRVCDLNSERTVPEFNLCYCHALLTSHVLQVAATTKINMASPPVVSGSSCAALPTASQARPPATAAPVIANGSMVRPPAPATMIHPVIPIVGLAAQSRDISKDVAADTTRRGNNNGPKTPNLVVNGTSAAIFTDRPKPIPRLPSHDSPKTDCTSEFGAKASSMDGKSVASANALDEKESLRPDDSASVMAAAEDDDTSIRGSIIAGSRVGSDLAYRARNLTLGDAIVPDRRPIAPAAMVAAGAGAMTPQSALSDQRPPLATFAQGQDSVIYQQNPDDKLLDAMKSPRDRLFLIKLESQLIDFVTNSKDPYMDVREGPERSLNTFYRMLAHKLADYYHMTHTYEPSADGVRIYRTPFCRVPPSLVHVMASTSPTHNTPPPTILPKKIMKRGEDMQSNQSGPGTSKGTSEAGSDSKDKEKAGPPKES
jgi:hypothetical protein